MKKIILLSFLSLSTIGFSQQIPDSLIVEVYGNAQYTKWKNADPALLSLMKNYIDRGVKISESNQKYDQLPLLTEIELRSKDAETITVEQFLEDYHSGNFNPLKYKFFPKQAIQVFRIGGGKVIIIDNQPNLK